MARITTGRADPTLGGSTDPRIEERLRKHKESLTYVEPRAKKCKWCHKPLGKDDGRDYHVGLCADNARREATKNRVAKYRKKHAKK